METKRSHGRHNVSHRETIKIRMHFPIIAGSVTALMQPFVSVAQIRKV
jgi:hypothetical protein